MLDGIKRWLTGAAPVVAPGFEGIAAWAAGAQHSFRSVQEDGFVIDGRLGSTLWRLEWGPSQRPYFSGHELRLRAEPGVEADLQLVVMSRALQEQLEKTLFEQYVEDVQTRIDNETPPEMRWLVMFPKLPGSEMGVLREAYVAVGNAKSWLQAWLQGDLSAALAAHPAASPDPLVLMLGRGRLMLRTVLAVPTVPQLQRCLLLFETALRAAHRVQTDNPDGLPAPSGQGGNGGNCDSTGWGASTARGGLDGPASKP